MQIREIMTKNIDWIKGDGSVIEAARRMRDEDIGALPVADDDQLIGMLTDRDIVIRALPDGKDPSTVKVREAMSGKVLYCFDDQEAEDVAANMGDNQVRRLPVVNRDKRLVGMVSLGDIAEKASERTAGEALGEISEDRPSHAA